MSTKPGVTMRPVASMVSAASCSPAVAVATTNLDDPAVLDPDVGTERLVPVPSTTEPPDRQVVHAASSTGEPTVRVVRTMVAG
jgi:hypothetical protein